MQRDANEKIQNVFASLMLIICALLSKYLSTKGFAIISYSLAAMQTIE